MTKSSAVFRVGTRASKLALVQTRETLEHFKGIFPGITFEAIPTSTPGDRDRTSDLRKSPSDFFTRDLDEAVMSGKIDCAIHSAKDMPDPLPDGLDWFWLPWREDPRDVIVVPAGKSTNDIPDKPRIGASSERRETWCRKRFPEAQLCNIRGSIEERLVQLDQGNYDIIIMAAAALIRLGLEDRISEWIPMEDMQAPDGQGILAITFKTGNERFLRLRSLFTKTVNFVGAGVGSADNCTMAGIKALQRCDACLYDLLMDHALLDYLPANALRVDTGKRCGSHSMLQVAISGLITMYARKGMRVVRLKGGDPGIFGRLAEEIEALDALHLPYKVIPGVSSLNTATSGTGMLLTRRGVSRGFCVMTPRQQNGGTGSVQKDERAKLPITFFMGVSVTEEVIRQLLEEGMPGNTPAAMVFSTGTDSETIIRGTLNDIGKKIKGDASSCAELPHDMPGLFIVGEITKFGFNKTWGALQGYRILLTCSDDLQAKASDIVTDLGGIPVKLPLIKLIPEPNAMKQIKSMDQFHWLVLTSPSSVRCFFDLFDKTGENTKVLPKIIVCGPGTERELRKYRVIPEVAPASDFGAGGLTEIAAKLVKSGQTILRLRSNKAGPDLAEFLRTLGARVTDCVLYRNDPISYDTLPEFDAVFFASASAVEVFVSQWGRKSLQGKIITAIGRPTCESLAENNLNADVVGREATVASSIETLAEKYVNEALEK